MDTEQIINSIVLFAVFGLVFSIWCICVFLWLGRYLTRLQSVQKRLGIVETESTESQTLRLWREAHRDMEGYVLPQKLTLSKRLERLRSDAGWRASAQVVMLGVAGTAILGFVTAYLLGSGVILGLGVSAAIVFVFWSYTRRRITKRAALLERQLVDALGISARALRAGHPLAGAFQLVSEEIGEPLGDIFFRICQAQSLGLDMKDSIRKVAQTSYNPELKLFATANLADLMDTLASVIRARMKLNRRVRVMTAQTQLSKKILIGLPIVLFFLLHLISPEYMGAFRTTVAGRYMLLAMVSSILLGSWVMNRISVLRF
ncbi:MAG: type II secretion system F family protein [Planctomycetota bacterium]|jgi:tight adherence protein B